MHETKHISCNQILGSSEVALEYAYPTPLAATSKKEAGKQIWRVIIRDLLCPLARVIRTQTRRASRLTRLAGVVLAQMRRVDAGTADKTLEADVMHDFCVRVRAVDSV